jgi:hypothetical protein
MTLSAPRRKALLAVHVATSVGFAGAVAAFLALAIAGLGATDGELAGAMYLGMQITTSSIIVPLAIASLAVGILDSLATPWGLVRYYWVVVKLSLTVAALAVLLLQVPTIDLLAEAAREGTLGDYAGARFSMILHGAGGLAVLLVVVVLSVYKPRGVTRHGARMLGT